MRHKRHDIEKFTKEGLTNYKRKSKKRLQKKKFTKEEILQKKKKHKREKFLNLQKRKRKQIFTKDKKQHKIFYTKEKAKQIFYKRGTEKRNAKRKDRRTRRESPRKIGIIGLGHVGAHVAYSLAVQGIADELVLVDSDEKKVESECQDLRDSVAYLPHRVTVNIGTYEDLGDCDVIVNSIGKIEILRANQDRTDEMKFTVPAVNSYVGRVKASGFDGVVVNITNPCDVVTQQLAKGLGLPRGRVFGTGTGLDTSRLLSALARQTGIDHKSITAYMLGEHGNQQFAAWSNVSFRGKSLEEWAKTDERFRFDRDALQKESIRGGWVTFSGKYCTEYGIATTAARMVSIVLHDEKQIMPASAELCGEYGEKDVFVGVPCVIGKNGVEEVVELSLNEREKEELKKSCDVIRGNIKMVEEKK